MFGRFLSTLGAAALFATLLSSAAFAAEYKIVPTIPLQGDHVRTARPTIAFQIHSSDDTASVPQSAVRLYLDDVEVTGQLAVEGANLAFVPQQSLALGSHEVRVAVDDGSGGSIGYSWTFTIDADDQPAPSQAQSFQDSPYGTLAPLADQYSYGDDAGFLFSGPPGGYGYLTFAGFPGSYPLLPVFGYANVYYAGFPVPWGYASNAPGVVCHFYGPGGGNGVAYSPVRPVVFVPQPAPSNRRYIENGPGFATSGHPVVVSAPVGTGPARSSRFLAPVSAHPNVSIRTEPFRAPSAGAAAAGTTVTVAAPTVPTTHGYVPPGQTRTILPVAGANPAAYGFSPRSYGTLGAPMTARPPTPPARAYAAPVRVSAPVAPHVAPAAASNGSRGTR